MMYYDVLWNYRYVSCFCRVPESETWMVSLRLGYGKKTDDMPDFGWMNIFGGFKPDVQSFDPFPCSMTNSVAL